MSVAFNKDRVREALLAKGTDYWGESNALVPNDAIYLVRITNLDKFLDFVLEMQQKSGKTLAEVCVAIRKNDAAIKSHFPYIDKAIDQFLADYGVAA